MYGADKVLFDLVRNLDKTRYRAYVILPDHGILVDAFKQERVNVTVLPYPIMRRKYFNPKGILRFWLEINKSNNQLAKIAANCDIDIVHTNTAAVLEGCFLSKRLHVPQIWSIHEIIEHPRIIYKFTSKMIAQYSTQTVCVSSAVKTHLEESGYFHHDQIKIIYNGVDSERFSPNSDCEYLYREWNIPKSAKIIGMIGRVNSWKGQADFLDAVNTIMKDYTNVYAIFVGAAFKGEEWREEELKEKIANSPYRSRIINMGYRSDNAEIYKLLDIFVLPSTSPDPLPTVVLESMATGKPIVGYRHGGICEMVKEGYNGLLADVGNTEDLACKIKLLLDDDQMRKEFGEHSRERLLENFSLESYIKNYSETYDNLIKDCL
jgi:glycosyltransferase involved in cell wall biosynthesis